MLNRNRDKQQGMELVTYELLVPQDHLLRKIDAAIDFSFIYKLCAPLYCTDNGRPAIDPEILFRMLIVGYLYGIRSEVRIAQEVQCNMAYRWFCGLGITEKVPDHATISANRQRRFRDNNIAEQIFNEILRQAQEKGLVDGKLLYTDSTHVKAKANKHKKQAVEIPIQPKAYMKALDEAVNADRERLEKKPFEKRDDNGPPTRTIQQSPVDPESGQLHKEGKPDGFHYSEHRTVDSKRNIVVNVHMTPANVNDVDPVPEILDEIEKRLGYLPEYMGMDAGYHNSIIARELYDREIQPVLDYRRHTHAGDHWGKYRFKYIRERNAYICPEGHELLHKTTNRSGYREYYSDSRTCTGCPRRKECFGEKASRRLVTRHVWQDYLDDATEYAKTPTGKLLYSWRKETIERSFADAKELHGMRTARMRGLANMREQSFLTAAVQNMKKIANVWHRSLAFLSCCASSFMSNPMPFAAWGLSMG